MLPAHQMALITSGCVPFRLDKLAELMDAKVQRQPPPPILPSFCRHLPAPPRPGRALAGVFARGGGRARARAHVDSLGLLCAGPQGALPLPLIVAVRGLTTWTIL